MKQVSIKLYQFSELENDAKATALDKMRDINADLNWWDFRYEDFKTIAESIGLRVNLNKTYFTGFYHQGQGSGFTASINIIELLHGCQKKSWKQYAPALDFDFPELKIDRRIIDLIERGIIHSWAEVTPSNKGTSINVSIELIYSSNRCVNYDRIDAELTRLEEWIEEVCEDLNHFLFNSLQNEYEYLTGDEAVTEAIEANEYNFTIEGKPAFCIERLAEQVKESQ